MLSIIASQFITWPSHVYNRKGVILYYNQSRVKMYNMNIENPDPAEISILTPERF